MADRNNMNGLPNGMPNPWAQLMDAAAIGFQHHPFFAAFNPEVRDRGNDDARAPPPDYEDPPASVPNGDATPPPPPPGHGPPPHRRGHRGPHHGPHYGPPPHDDDPFSGHGFGFGGPYANFGEPSGAPFQGPFWGGPSSTDPSAGGPFGGRGGFGGRGRGWRGGWGGRGRGNPREGSGDSSAKDSAKDSVNGSANNTPNNPPNHPFEYLKELTKDVDVEQIKDFFAQMASHLHPDAPLDTPFNARLNKNRSGPAPEGKDFKPAADIYDTPEAFVVHLSLPGAKKEDVGVNWDAEKYELCVAGVIHRPGDEEMLMTLSLDERQVGAFERKIALGARETPAHIDAEGISAKMEDGVLMITAPKMEQDFVEVKKVQIE